MIVSHFESRELVSVLVSMLCGACIGMEREYKSKFAGFRTIILICAGSTVFTLASLQLSNSSPDRVASNIVTGIGFIGAGVIFRSKLWVKGLTTAAVIWISAAIGMICGTGNYLFAGALTLAVIIVLTLFNVLEGFVDSAHQRKQVSIIFNSNSLDALFRLEQYMLGHGVSSRRLQVEKSENSLVATLSLSGRQEHLLSISEYMVGMNEIASFETLF